MHVFRPEDWGNRLASSYQCMMSHPKRVAIVRTSKSHETASIIRTRVYSVQSRSLRSSVLTNSMEQALLEKLKVPRQVEKFLAFYATLKFITVFTTARQLSLFWATSVQSTSSPLYFLKTHYNIILPSQPRSSKWCISSRVSPPKICTQFSPLSYVPHALPTFFLMWSREYQFRGTDCKVLCYDLQVFEGTISGNTTFC